MTQFPWTALVTLATVALLVALAGWVGRQRGHYRVRAPAVTGPAEFERAFRVHMNTLESTVVFLPLLWLCAVYLGDAWAAALGAAWVAARVWYAVAYQRHAAKRGTPFGLSMLIAAVLGLGAAWGVLKSLF